MVNIQRIKNGGVAKLSISQVANAIINLPDAKAKLNPEVYKKVEDLFVQFQT